MVTITLFLILIYFFLYFRKRKKNNRKLRAAQNYTKQKYLQSEQDLYSIIEKTLGLDQVVKVKNDTFWKGMPDCLLYKIYGIPNDTQERRKPGKIYKTWLYSPIPNVRKNAKRKHYAEIYSENGIVTDWDILN